MITHKATGIVLGNCWGDGVNGYAAETLTDNSITGLHKQILNGIKDGSLDSGMGYESLIGAVMTIETIDSRKIDGKTFIAKEYELKTYGSMTEDQEEMLIEAVCS
ncbi:hypothetical protein LCGC14_0437560 [marine sediment metagenome]|uniref:Uncharacterized protein n=1 Tax=marine sediment metagenome TaxID=412755 RepID=A0A0F9SLF4_9ZZZZ